MNQPILSLPLDSPGLSSVLMNGSVSQHGETWDVIPRELIKGHQGTEALVFEVVRPESLLKPNLIRILFEVIRPRDFVLIAIPVLNILLYGIHRQWQVHGGVALSAALGLFCFQMAIYAMSDVEDHLRFVDWPGKGIWNATGSGALQKGWLKARDLKRWGLIAFFLGGLFGLPAVIESPQILLVLGGAGALGVLLYSGWPFYAKYHAVGFLLVFLLLGPLLTTGFSQAAFGHFDGGTLVLGMTFGLLAWLVSHSRTLQTLDLRKNSPFWGFRPMRHFYVGLFFAAVLVLALGGMFSLVPIQMAMFCLLSLFWASSVILKIYRASGPASALLGGLRRETLTLYWIFGILIALSWVLV